MEPWYCWYLTISPTNDAGHELGMNEDVQATSIVWQQDTWWRNAPRREKFLVNKLRRIANSNVEMS